MQSFSGTELANLMLNKDSFYCFNPSSWQKLFAKYIHVIFMTLFSVLDADFPYKNVSMQRLKGHIDGRYIVCEQVGQ